MPGTDDFRSLKSRRPAGVPRNTGDAPKFLRFDFNISKAFFFEAAGGTRTNLNVFANITNAFNNVNFNAPSGVMTSPISETPLCSDTGAIKTLVETFISE